MISKHPFATVRPMESLDLLSQREMVSLATADQQVHQLFRRCALAVLNTGGDTDDAHQLYQQYPDFEVHVVSEPRGLKLELYNAPAPAFVDGKMIQGIRSHLFTALRDIVFTHQKLVESRSFDLDTGAGLTDTVFRILRNAGIVSTNVKPRLVVCWGGHSISREEYEFTKEVGYELGLRGMDIATGCGPGAMKGPMKGATIAHAKQFNPDARYIGISEPGIIAAESPNPLVNQLVILPDIEKRLEAFVRLAHGVVVFPGGAGTLEELLFLLGIAMHPGNRGMPLPIVLAAGSHSADYFHRIDTFIRKTLGDAASDHYEIIVGDPVAVARRLKAGIRKVRDYRIRRQESFGFNWGLVLDEALQRPFEPDHDSMSSLALHREQPANALLSELRRAFSGIVAGNVKEAGIDAVAKHGPYQLRGAPEIIDSLRALLDDFVAQGRMKLDTDNYTPCFELRR